MTRLVVEVPVHVVNGEQWGRLSVFGDTHHICGERVDEQRDISHAGGHRVRLVRFKKNVNWKIPVGTQIDISAVKPEETPRRRK